MNKKFEEIFSIESQNIIRRSNANINDKYIVKTFRDNNIFVIVHPTLSINNGKTISNGAYHLTGNYYFEISIYDKNGDLVQLVYSNDITDEKYTSFETAEAAAVECLLKY